MDLLTPARAYAPGIGNAVADRTINRKLHPQTRVELETWLEPGKDTREFVREDWADVAHRVARGNSLLNPLDAGFEFVGLNRHLRQASVLMSGRHLQHGDERQSSRPMEVFTNCSTAATRFLLFYLLLNGSGVGTCYDNDMQVVDYNHMPIVVTCIDPGHGDVQTGEIKATNLKLAQHLYAGRETVVFNVPDSREGWAKAIEQIDLMTFQKKRDTVLLLDFSGVRKRGSPIAGMQNRPASGPGPLMDAINSLTNLRDANMPPWRAAMYADDYLAQCVLVGGARRAARMATKTWRDADVIDFIKVKRGGFLWTSNNSVTVDEEFWKLVTATPEDLFHESSATHALADHAKLVFEAICFHSYHDQTGEPGIINVDKLVWNGEGVEKLFDGNIAESARYKLDDATLELTKSIVGAWLKNLYKVITNPCGEIVLSLLGGYCVIADVVPYHAGTADPLLGYRTDLGAWDDDAEDAFRVAVRALIRTNLMDSLYSKEVKRTNRIGVGMTGIHEYAWARFGYGWKDLVNEQASLPFWQMMSRFSNASVDEARDYSTKLGVVMPHTVTTFKPAGTTSKLFSLTEGAHLPSMRWYMRWVQFANGDPLIEEYRSKGYPVRELKIYAGMTIIGFPTAPEICKLGMGDKLVTAAEATPEEQYEWLRLIEKYWLGGYCEGVVGVTGTQHGYGNQVSYTLKYDPKVVSYEEFRRTLLEGQRTVRCCSVMPQADTSAYEYQPEEPISAEAFALIVAGIERAEKEDIGLEHVGCASGACPINFDENR